MRWTMSGAYVGRLLVPCDDTDSSLYPACRHLMFLESLQNIYKRAETIPPAEEQDFALFVYIAVAVSHPYFDE